MSQNDMRLHIFLFLLRISLFITTGIVLHSTDGPLVLTHCAGLWESMLAILCIKCVRLTLFPLMLRAFKIYQRSLHHVNVLMYAIFFIVECVMTSQSLNSQECVAATSHPSGHPMLSYVNGITSVYDGAYLLSHVLFTILNRRF